EGTEHGLESSKSVCERGAAFSPEEELFRKWWAGFVNRFEDDETLALSSRQRYIADSRCRFKSGRFRAYLAQHRVECYIDCERRKENRADVAPSAPIGLAVEGIGVD